ncbi:2-oxoacid:ferredoxin oxidoreductase subunit gamma [Thermanaerosceptrum fracticalcis]|uniref:2-oxoacid:ferredoxin oxidoreductase subunit gamma n=1 Tax=Thermanaerosceptrum fracticalcis TaxID=1712410 RepID=A0A7G6E3H2_THEFR|nr:2-oxoacid:acceptor oxidoreductase family protein [Thermanaerosceptrum fracticalcis]QNB46626.1 2-oxoacid:ferredoxin oxidoreductase subunit gamma [Thermanaerosceptrum fracticalcis]
MLKQMILAGFGGQGVMSMGQLLVYGGMLEGKEVAWIPSYGPEMRGGTANCSVTISSSPISSPLVTEPDIVVAMNRPSLDKFEPLLKPGGILFINSSLIDRPAKRTDITVYYVPVNEKAGVLGESRVANMVMLGALLQAEPLIKPLSVMESLKKVLPENKHHLLPLNAQALAMGAEVVKEKSNKKTACKVG